MSCSSTPNGSAEEDEPLTDEERARVDAGEAEIRRGDYVTLEALR